MITDKELIEIMAKWKDEFVQVIRDYDKNISVLDVISKRYEQSFYQKNKVWLAPLIILASIGVFLFIISGLNWCSVEFQGVKITKQCVDPSSVNEFNRLKTTQ